MHESPDVDSIFEPVQLAMETALSGVKTVYLRGLDEKEEQLMAALEACATAERKLARRKKAQPLEATIKAAITRNIRQNSKEFPDLPSARLETEGRNVIDTHLDKLRDHLERHMKTEIDSRIEKGTGSS
jgi:hypothetical protein